MAIDKPEDESTITPEGEFPSSNHSGIWDV
jgi:hypothetical protein